MQPMRTLGTLFTFVILLALAPVGPSRAQQGDGGPDGFDYFLLSLSLAPSFCALSPRNHDKDECQRLTEADFEATPLTVHGLWPNRARVSVNQQPHDCPGPELGPLPDALEADLHRYMPGGAELEGHEWSKHGACSGLTPQAYFGAAVSLAKHADDTVGAALRDGGMLGRTVRIADLLAAAAARDPALGPAMVVDCERPRGGGDALITEIRVVLAKDFTPMPADSVGLGQNSGCPGGMGFVPEVGR